MRYFFNNFIRQGNMTVAVNPLNSSNLIAIKKGSLTQKNIPLQCQLFILKIEH